MILCMYLWYLERIWRKSAIPDTKNVSGTNLCQHDLAKSAKSADFWLSGRHVDDMSATFPAKEVTPDLGEFAEILDDASVEMIPIRYR